MQQTRQQAPEWVYEQFYQRVCEILKTSDEFVIDWHISKQTMIATINYLRGKDLMASWIEKGEQEFLIKVTKKQTQP